MKVRCHIRHVFWAALFLCISSASAAFAGAKFAERACALLKTSYYSEEEKEQIAFYCSLDKVARNNLPDHYWLRTDDYQNNFLTRQASRPQAPRNVTQKDDDLYVSRILNHPEICQFYSSISPSVQSRRVSESARLKVVGSPEELLAKCETVSQQITLGQIPLCSVIELAGHSTQSVGLDTILGIDYAFGRRQVFPEKRLMSQIGACFRKILKPQSGLVFSSCGGERALDGRYYYWINKGSAQQELANELQLPILSSIGPVRFSSKNGPNGAATTDGWTLVYPRK